MAGKEPAVVAAMATKVATGPMAAAVATGPMAAAVTVEVVAAVIVAMAVEAAAKIQTLPVTVASIPLEL